MALLASFFFRRAIWQATVGMTFIGGGAGEVVDVIDLRELPPAPVVVDMRDMLPVTGERPLRKSIPTTLVIHHTATETADWETIADLHARVNGWRAIGYAFGVQGGTKFILHDPERVQVHAKDHNATTIGMAINANLHERAMTDQEVKAVLSFARSVKEQYGYRYIRPHRDIRATACPGKYAMVQLDELWTRPQQ